MQPTLSVIICTHNPRRDYLDKVLTALKDQTLYKERWELLLIDNASDRLLSREIDLNWHPQARHIREERLGLTPARLRGIQEAKADLLIFVDDDNVLDGDYLKNALEISSSHLMLGAWGGQTLPEFEHNPPAWTEQYWSYIGIRKFDQSHWSKTPLWEATPIGAGVCIRKQVAKAYADLIRNDSRRLMLGRSGNLLLSCEDLDMVYTAHDLDLYTGLFANLKLQHLMPSKRLEEQYLLKIYEGNAYSATILSFLRGQIKLPLDLRTQLKLIFPWLRRPTYFFQNRRQKKFGEAEAKGRVNALKEILELSA
ncbi:glycosyltransferase family 2 protein [Phormidium sp. CLA17]|uniref:glycosyltransferase n=1 Tax=Leptolyngbya sp. Cla-17 TaxID=2803751 RepID=UPI0014917230|nr:glycosyltransferase [Leptolyngbya sp. Cla-17]MBM0741371.1 glycosyltransferase family 2 protein [Leptolyngbya sp. Cla-17]